MGRFSWLTSTHVTSQVRSALRAEVHEVMGPAAKLLLWHSNARQQLSDLEEAWLVPSPWLPGCLAALLSGGRPHVRSLPHVLVPRATCRSRHLLAHLDATGSTALPRMDPVLTGAYAVHINPMFTDPIEITVVQPAAESPAAIAS